MPANIPLEGKDFVLTVKWTVDASTAIKEGIEDYLERLREIGSADIVDVKLQKHEED